MSLNVANSRYNIKNYLISIVLSLSVAKRNSMNLSNAQKTVLEVIVKKETTTTSEIVEITGLEKRTVQRVLKKLVELKRIDVNGVGRSRSYQRIYTQGDATSKIIVFSSGKKVGELWFGEGSYSFKYDDTYTLEEFEGLSKGVISTSSTLFPYFENLIPEYTRRDRLLQDKDIADVLILLNNSHGALDFIPRENLFKYKPRYGKRENWLTVKNKILGTNDFPNLIDVKVDISDDILEATGNTEHSDLSGYQTKVDVNFDKDSMVVYESKEAKYLLKPMNKAKSSYFNADENGKKRYYPYIAINEHLFMTFAKNELGFDVPYTAIIKAKDTDYHYLTKRFDRLNGLKYAHVDFAQVMNISSENKYKSYSEDLFLHINQKLSTPQSKMDAIKFYYYSYLIKHADLHLKNIGALEIGNKKYILTPLYDLISVGVYNGDSLDLGLGMKTPLKKAKNWKMEDFHKLANFLGISTLAFNKEARVLTKTFINEFPKYISKLKVFEKKQPLLVQKTRETSGVQFSQRIENMYIERVISLKKLGFLKELKLEKEYGLLNVQK